MNKKSLIIYLTTSVFLVFGFVSLFFEFKPGVDLLNSFWAYAKFILAAMPGVFIIIGLFNVWIKRETVTEHLGEESGVKGYIIAILLAFTCIGGLFTALPIARQLFDKGTKVSVILVYLGASCVCRIPMSLFEASMLGYKFTLIRYIVSLPLIIISSILLEKCIDRANITTR
jgi:uncharacterized membrane protein YraQ (UPF0718 family)